MNIGGTVSIEVGSENARPNNTLVFPANPDQHYSADMRVTTVQTLDGLYFDDYGTGIARLQLSGTTAFNSSQGRFNGQQVDGNTAAYHLYKDIIQYYFQQEEQQKGKTVLALFDDVFGRAWQLKPEQPLQLTRSASEPTILMFSQTFVVIQEYPFKVTQQKLVDTVQSNFSSTKSVSITAQNKITQSNTTTQSVKQTSHTVYTVVNGDTLWGISQRFLPKYVSNAEVQAFVNQVVLLNGIRNANLIFDGEQIKIP